jgi:hypothetical protein
MARSLKVFKEMMVNRWPSVSLLVYLNKIKRKFQLSASQMKSITFVNKLKKMETVNFSGQVSFANNQAASGLDVLLVNLEDRTHQNRIVTNETGNFSIGVAQGIYDVFFSSKAGMPVIKAGLLLQQDLVLNIPLRYAEPAAKRIIGQALLPDGSPASGYQVELLSGDASVSLAKKNCGVNGEFEFSNCVPGYHLLRLQNTAGNLYTVAMPMPDQSVNIQIILRDKQKTKRFVTTPSPPTEAMVSNTFAVCKESIGPFIFTGGLMTAAANAYMRTQANPLPVILNIYTAKSSNPIYSYAVCVDCTSNPFYAMPPGNNYTFTDKTGDGYYLSAFWPMLHTVSYNSSDPDIVKVFISADKNDQYYWHDAPVCAG